MSEFNQNPAYIELFFADHKKKYAHLANRLKLPIPSRYHPENLSSDDEHEKSCNIVLSLEHTLEIISDYADSENLSAADCGTRIENFQKSMAIENFWNACESHGKLVALSRSLEKGSLPDFVASIGDEGIALAAFSLLQRLAIAHDEPTTQAQILAENSEFVADLLKCESISRSLVKVLHECTHHLKIIPTIPRSKAEIRKATGRLQAGSLWLSHSLWLMDINTRCQFIPSLTRKTEGDLRHKNKDALFCDPQITRYQNGKFYSQNAVIAAILPAEF